MRESVDLENKDVRQRHKRRNRNAGSEARRWAAASTSSGGTDVSVRALRRAAPRRLHPVRNNLKLIFLHLLGRVCACVEGRDRDRDGFVEH